MSKKPEQLLWSSVKRLFDLNKRFIEYNRIESSIGCGVPDVSFVMPGCHGWIELKVSTTMGLKHFTRSQRIWLSKRHKLAGHTWLLLQHHKINYLIDGIKAEKLTNDDLPNIKNFAIWGGPTPNLGMLFRL